MELAPDAFTVSSGLITPEIREHAESWSDSNGMTPFELHERRSNSATTIFPEEQDVWANAVYFVDRSGAGAEFEFRKLCVTDSGYALFCLNIDGIGRCPFEPIQESEIERGEVPLERISTGAFERITPFKEARGIRFYAARNNHYEIAGYVNFSHDNLPVRGTVIINHHTHLLSSRGHMGFDLYIILSDSCDLVSYSEATEISTEGVALLAGRLVQFDNGF